MSMRQLFMAAIALVCIAWPGTPAAQVTPSADRDAQQEVADRPTLSADRVVQILQKEPGLLLQVKKLLIQKAREQGRILLQKDLTDDAVFELIGTSPTIRALATDEIERRNYISLRPTEEELKDQESAPPAPNAPTSGEASLAAPSKNETLHDQPKAPRDMAPMPPLNPGDLNTLPLIRANDLPTLLAASSKSPADAGGAPQMPSGGAEAPIDANTIVQASELARSREQLNAPPPRRDRPATPPAGAEPKRKARDDSSSSPNRSTNPYANVPSLYDLYAQAAPPSKELERFGASIYKNGSGNSNDLPMDLPVGPDYVIGPGDGLNIELWGSAATRLQRVVDRTGRVALPEVGLVNVAGRTLRDAQHSIQAALRTQFRDMEADLSLVRLRSIRVYVVGDVERPGGYDISSLSTPINAVYQAGGPTSRGSIRTIRHYRGKQLLQEVDAYSLILRGVREDGERLQDGDTIVVPPSANEVRVEGMVRRPAIYELREEKTLGDALALAGGVLPTGTLRHVEVERVEAHVRRVTLSVDLPEEALGSVDQALASFKVQEGDRIRVAPILPYSQQTVYLDGHVFNPGKFPYHQGLTVADVVRSYAEVLPEPYQHHAEVIRLQPPDFRPVVLAFDLGSVLGGQTNMDLQPFDTVRIFGRYDFEDAPVITVNGEVRSPGEHRTNGETRLLDAVYLAGGLTPDAAVGDVEVFRHTSNSTVKVMNASLARALAGDAQQNIVLQPKDRIFIHRNLAKADPAIVQIQGEVVNPGRYPLADGMTASDLVRLAGGFKRSAYVQKADLSRSTIKDGRTVDGEHTEVEIAKAVQGDLTSDVALRNGDTLTIRQIAGWNDMGAAITIKGEVLHAGTYGIREGDRLSSVLKRAGGLRATAYPRGAVLERTQVREFAEKSRAQLIRRIEAEQPTVKLGAGMTASEQTTYAQAFMAQRQQILSRLRSDPVSGRQVINISPDISKWENTPADIEVRAGDVLFIPKKPNFVLVSGQVYNPSAISYSPGKNAGWYLRQAGGVTDTGNRDRMFIIRADGSVVGNHSGLWSGGASSSGVQPGDVIVVPEKVIGGSLFWKNMLSTAQIVANIAISAQLLTGL